MQVFEDNDHCTKDVPIHHQPAPPSLMMMQVLALLLLCIVPRTQAYASWLKCFVDLDDSEVVMNHEIVPANKAPHPVTVVVRPVLGGDEENDAPFSPELTYAADTVTSLEVRLNVPAALEGEDVQYVVESSAGAVFVKPEMCGGRRSHARSAHQSVLLEVDGTRPTIELLAGWATGHEAVKLTTKTVLRRRQDNEL